MEHTLNHGMCRCCASEGLFKNFNSTYQWMGADEVYADMLKECFDITLTTAEEWNNGGICEVCITQLRNASNFKKQVLQTEDQFKKALHDKLFQASIVKEELNREDGDLDSDHNVSEDYSGTDFDVPIKEEMEEPKTKKRAAKAGTSRAKKAKTDDGEPSAKRAQRKDKAKTEKRVAQVVKTSRLLKRQLVVKTEPVSTNFEMKETRELEKHRFNIRQILQYSNATPIRCRGGIGYACCFCTNQFPDPTDLKKHTLGFHDDKSKRFFMKGKMMFSYLVKLDITSLECRICDTPIDNLEQLIDHLIKVHQKSMFTDIKNHIMPFKFTDEVLRCIACPSVFNKFKALQEHMNTHYRNYICEVCDAGFVNKNILLSHAEGHKTGTFKCDFCAKVYTSHRKKKSHEKSVHIHANMLNRCGYCNEKFKDYRSKEKHLSTVHGVQTSPLKCQACEKSFSTKTALTVHTKRDHLMERRHECKVCDMKFFVTNELKEHMVVHTGIRKFECQVCHKAYGRRKTLREHMRIHADDRRFKCEHCGMAFVQKCSWRGHVRAKHGEKYSVSNV